MADDLRTIATRVIALREAVIRYGGPGDTFNGDAEQLAAFALAVLDAYDYLDKGPDDGLRGLARYAHFSGMLRTAIERASRER